MSKMTTPKRPLIVFFAFAAFLLILFSSTNVKSYKAGPPAYYCNDPNPYNPTLNCTYCHSSFTAFHDSTNFIFQMGTDTQSLTEVFSGVTTYTPGVKYFLRMIATSPAAVHGFELTAEDTTRDATPTEGTEVTNFAILNPVNTILLSTTYGFVTHKNADSNRVWTFTWTAPTTYEGPVTFYYAGNAGVDTDTNIGDSIFVATKTIAWSGLTGVPQINGNLNLLSIFPTVFDGRIQVSFNMKERATVQGTIINLNGQLVKSILNEELNPGNFSGSYDLSNLAAGVYLLKLQTGDAFAVRKIVKQ
jgi:hypothetical protein